jgi:hypothetical protein
MLDTIIKDGSQVNVYAIAQQHGLEVDWHFQDLDGAKVKAELEQLAHRVATGEQLRLMCWCHPKRCHTWAIADAVMGLAAQQTQPAQRRARTPVDLGRQVIAELPGWYQQPLTEQPPGVLADFVGTGQPEWLMEAAGYLLDGFCEWEHHMRG